MASSGNCAGTLTHIAQLLNREVQDFADNDEVDCTALEEALRQFRFITESSGDENFLVDAGGCLVYINDTACQTLGYPCEELLGQSLAVIDHEFDPRKYSALFAEAAAGDVPPLVTNHIRKDGTSYPVETKVRMLELGGNRLLLACSRDITLRVRDEERILALLAQSEAYAQKERLLREVGELLRTTLDPEQVKVQAVETLGRALSADRCFWVQFSPEDSAYRIGPDYACNGLESLEGSLSVSTIPQFLLKVTKTWTYRCPNESPLPDDLKAYYTRIGIGSFIRVPLQAHGGIVNCLYVAMSSAAREWTQVEVDIAEEVASLTRATFLAAETAQRQRRIASALQEALLPEVPRTAAGLTVAKHYEAALSESSVGGDFYDVFMLDDNRVALVLGDVSGKGLAAATQLAMLRNLLRSALYRHTQVVLAVEEVNDLLTSHDLLDAYFATLIVGIYDQRDRSLRAVSCGHEPGLIARAPHGVIEVLPAGGMPIGIPPPEKYEEFSTTLCEGDVLFLYTDGVTDAGQDRADQNNYIRLCGYTSECVGKEAQEVVDYILEHVRRDAKFLFRDDVCVLACAVPCERLTYERLTYEDAPKQLEIAA